MRVLALCGIMTKTEAHPSGSTFEIDDHTGQQLADAGQVRIIDRQLESTAKQAPERTTRRKAVKRGTKCRSYS